MENRNLQIQNIKFNVSCTEFVVSTNQGFYVFQTHPFAFHFVREFGAQLAEVQQLNRSNIFGFIGGGQNPRFSKNRMLFWDDCNLQIQGEYCFKEEVKGFQLGRDILAVALEYKVYIFDVQDLTLKDSVKTYQNIKGLVCISEVFETTLATLSKSKGQILVKGYHQQFYQRINAHRNGIAAISLNQDGRLIATASEKGTVIRIFDVVQGTILNQLRRGIDRAEIYSLVFNNNSGLIACGSDRGTLHIYQTTPQVDRISSAKRFVKKVIPQIFKSQNSFAKYGGISGRYACAFTDRNDVIIVVDYSGTYYKLLYTIESEDCIEEERFNIWDVVRQELMNQIPNVHVINGCVKAFQGVILSYGFHYKHCRIKSNRYGFFFL